MSLFKSELTVKCVQECNENVYFKAIKRFDILLNVNWNLSNAMDYYSWYGEQKYNIPKKKIITS